MVKCHRNSVIQFAFRENNSSLAHLAHLAFERVEKLLAPGIAGASMRGWSRGLIAAVFRGRIDLSHYGASNSAILSLRQAVSADQGPCLTISS